MAGTRVNRRTRCGFGVLAELRRPTSEEAADPTRLGVRNGDAFNLGFPLRPRHRWRGRKLPRKEVIQPHLPVGLPCYDLVPITDPTFDSCPLAVGALASGIADFRDLTGGVYKPREHIHRCVLTSGY